MTDAEYRSQCRRIKQFASLWRKKLGLDWWNLDLKYARSLQEFDFSEDLNACKSTVAYTHSQYEYLQAQVTFNVPEIASFDDTQLEEIILHEFMHILLCETRYGNNCECPFDPKREERVATVLARAFQRTRHATRTP